MNIGELSSLINGKYDKKYADIKFSSIKTNTNGLTKNDIFLAINKGHDYLNEIKKCKGVIVENEFKTDKFPVIKVFNTKEALKRIAIYKRNKYKGKIIAITGSNGKTTTKELLSSILSKKYKVFKSYKNMNNELGVPINMLSLNNSEIAIFELGMNQKGEISNLSKLIKPDIGIITNIGTAHIGNLGNQEAICAAKMEILDGMNNHNLFVNGEDKFLKNSYETIKVNLENNLFKIINVEEGEHLSFDLVIDKIYHITYKIPSKAHLSNVALAIYVSLYLGVKPYKIAKSLKSFKPIENRLEIIKMNDKIIINDSYNSNYESLMAGLDILDNYCFDKVCVIGSILELGSKEKEIYKKISSNLKPEYRYIFVGNNIKAKNAIYFNDVLELIDYYENNKEEFKNKVIYVKGSNGVNLIRFVKKMTV